MRYHLFGLPVFEIWLVKYISIFIITIIISDRSDLEKSAFKFCYRLSEIHTEKRPRCMWQVVLGVQEGGRAIRGPWLLVK